MDRVPCRVVFKRGLIREARALSLALAVFSTVCVLEGHAQWTLMDPDPEIVAYTNFLGQGLSLVDFNLDGWDDLTVTNASGELDFYLGGPGGFTSVDLGIVPSTGRPVSLLWIDIDNDGDRDLLYTAGMVVSAFSGTGQVSRSELWINEDGVFVDGTDDWGWDVLENRNASGMSLYDMDGDGDLDAMVPIYSLPCQGDWMTNNVLLKQGGAGFIDVSVSSGIADGFRSSFQSTWLHLDDDGLIDLFVINDAGVELACTMTNRAYLNQGDGTFTESSAELGLDVSMSSMSITVGDPDGDGQEEVFVTNQELNEFYPYPLETAGFFDRNENGQWEEMSAEVGLDADRWSWSALWVDQDLDGFEELVVATNLFSLPGSGGEVEFYDNHLFRPVLPSGPEGIAFEEDSSEWSGRSRPLHCLVRGDLDGDGDPDGLGLGTGPFAAVWMNEVEETHPEHSGVTVAVCGTHSNSEAIGTRMVLHAAGRIQQRTLRAGEDLFAQHSTTQFFGLGTAQSADSLEIFWPNGAREVHHGLVADSAYRFVQAGGEVDVEFGAVQGDSVELHIASPPKWTGVEWSDGVENGTTRWVTPGTPLSGQVSWFHGLFSVPFSVDWSGFSGGLTGCTVPVADNFNPAAMEDDGSCTYQVFCGPGTVWSVADQQCLVVEISCPPDVDGDGVIGVSDILQVLSYYGESCSAVTD